MSCHHLGSLIANRPTQDQGQLLRPLLGGGWLLPNDPSLLRPLPYGLPFSSHTHLLFS